MPLSSADYIPLSMKLVSIDTVLNFDLYHNQDGLFRLYRHRSIPLSQSDLDRLIAMGIESLYVPVSQKEQIFDYMRGNLATVLRDPTLPAQIKIELLTNTSARILEDVLQDPTSKGNVKAAVDQCENHVTMARMGNEAQQKMIECKPKFSFPISHAINVGNLAILLGLRCGIENSEELHHLGVGALLHEVGKTIIDNKYYMRSRQKVAVTNTRLKKYPIVGKDILQQTGVVPAGAFRPVLEHQERLDGSGYPRGLVSSQIGTPGRIVAICDHYDETTNSTKGVDMQTPYETLLAMKKSPKKYDRSILIEFIHLFGSDQTN